MQPEDAARVANLHIRCINEGFLVQLGPRFLRQLYLGIAADPDCRVWIASDGGAIAGFCAYARSVSGLYRRILRARFWRLALASLPRSLSPWVAKEVVDSLRYPAKQADKQLPPAEILSIAVDPDTRGGGVGRKLLDCAIEQARRDGQERIKVLAGTLLEGANRFYQACGFEKIGELTQHGAMLNVYAKKTQLP